MGATQLDFIKDHPVYGNIALEQGADFVREITYREGGAIVDLTGYTARMKIRKSVSAGGQLADWDETTEILLMGASDPNITIQVGDTATAALDWNGLAFYDLEVESAGGVTIRVIEGRIELSKEVTRT